MLLTMLLPTVTLASACTIESSACYPWRIEAPEKSTTLLEIVPNNAPTGVIYRVCICPPAKQVDLIFDFQSRRVTIGSIETKSGSTICRDFRIATARKSRLVLSRPKGASGVISGCYVTE
ncbi:MAG: hypothetical protein ACR2PI_16860 [Hyphomicrobiaceae bacterium]